MTGKWTRRYLNYGFVACTCIMLGCGDSWAADTGTEPPAPNSAVQLERLGSWSKKLKTGPNGPVPSIVVDQFGYQPNAKKVAVIREPHVGYDTNARPPVGTEYALVDMATGRFVKRSRLEPWNVGKIHKDSGDKAWWFDFSDVTAPGKYAVVDLDNQVRSIAFAIGDDVYREVIKHAVRMYFYQRAGFEKKAKYAGVHWADRASHVRRGQDTEALPWPSSRPSLGQAAKSTRKDLRGGWYDAGDYNKYTNWTARNIIVLLRAFEENPQAFRDDTGIPESGNGVPDLLDELRFGLEWMMRMQNDDGSVLCVQGLASGTPPSSATGKSYYGPATTSATLMSAATFAYAAKVFSARPEPELKALSTSLANRAGQAWEWAIANPSVRYYNNDEARQPGSSGLAHGQQEMSDENRHLAKFEAAVYLFALDGASTFKKFIEANYATLVPDYGPTQWDVVRQDIVLYFAQLPGVSPAVRTKIRERFLSRMLPVTRAFSVNLIKSDPYRAPMKDYTWGSNRTKAFQARLFQLTAIHAEAPADKTAALDAAMGYAHYIHGVNPLGLVYLSNMSVAGAEQSVNTIYHTWFAPGTRWSKVEGAMPGPPPGFLVGGPNPYYALDGCCKGSTSGGLFACGNIAAARICKHGYAPPVGQPVQKSYLQFNTNWPANSWEITEPSISYQSYYIRLLASFAR